MFRTYVLHARTSRAVVTHTPPTRYSGMNVTSSPATRASRGALVVRRALAWFVGFGRGLWLFPLDVLFRTVGLRYGWLRTLFIVTPAPLLRGIGQLRAERAAWRAARRVPA